MKGKADHLIIKDSGREAQCLHCGFGETYPLPMPLDDWLAAVNKFRDRHLDCLPPQQEGEKDKSS